MLFTFLAGALTSLGCVLFVGRFQLHLGVAYLLSINLVTLGYYGYDKLISGRRMLRVPEKSLHTLAFAGGTPFAFLAQKLFRHKTVKRSFRTMFWILAAIQAAIIAWVLWYVYGR
jgi:uncharacterized membrane protein YsdA (DUF1294 family)